jgi:hypothetical protein
MAKNRNKFMVGAATAAMVATAIAPAAGAEVNPNAEFAFSDVSAESSHYENIYKAYNLGFMKGYTDGTFKPAQTLTRSNVVKALGKYVVATSGKTLEEFDVSDVKPFNDVPASIADKELYNYSLIVKKAGIFSGDKNNLNPLNDITRQQMAKVLVNAFDLEDLEGKDSKVTDNDKAFAEFVPYINILSENGVTNVEEFMPKSDTTRAQFASFMIRAHEASKTPVVDELEVEDAWAINSSKIVVELSDGKEYTINLTEKERLTVGKNELTITIDGEDYDVTVNYEAPEVEAIEVVDANTITVFFDNDEEFTIDIPTLKDGKNTVKFTINGADYTETIEYDAPKAPVNVTAVNATEVAITFGKEVLASTAEVESNYTFVSQAPATPASFSPEDVQLQEDGRTVILRFAPGTLVDKTTYEVTAKDVITTDYQRITDFEKSFLFTADTAAPMLKGVQVEDAKLLISFNEEVNLKALSTILRIDGTEVSLEGAKPTVDEAGNYTYAITPNASVLNRGTHNVVLVGLKDVAGNEAGTLSTTYTVSADVTAPTVQKVEAVDVDTFRVTFSESLATTPALQVIKGNTEYAVEKIEASNDSKVFEVTIVQNAGYDKAGQPINPLYSTNQSSVNLSVGISDYRDTVGLLGAKTTSTVTLSRDTTAPTFLNSGLNTVEGTDTSTTIRIPFAETITEVEESESTIRVVTPAGVEVEATLEVEEGPTAETSTAVLTVPAALQNGTYSVTFGAGVVVDKEGNYNTAITTTAVRVAPVAYETFTGSVTVPSNNVIRVAYQEAVTNSALSVSNYTLDNAALPAGTTAVFVEDKSTVELRLPTSYTVVDDASFKFEISQNVKTEAGETIVANKTAATKTNYSTNITLRDNVAPTLQSARYALDAQGDTTTNRIQLSFSEDVVLVGDNNVVDDFSVVVNGTSIAVTNATYSGDDIVLTTAAPINTVQAATVSIISQGTANPAVAVTDASLTGNAAKAGTVSVSGSAVVAPQ